MAEIEYLASASSACALDNQDGDLLGIFQKGHHPPWELRRYAVWEEFVDEPGWPKREYWQDIPWSILYPEEGPCDNGPEQIIFETCKRDTPGAYPVTVLRFM